MSKRHAKTLFENNVEEVQELPLLGLFLGVVGFGWWILHLQSFSGDFQMLCDSLQKTPDLANVVNLGVFDDFFLGFLTYLHPFYNCSSCSECAKNLYMSKNTYG